MSLASLYSIPFTYSSSKISLTDSRRLYFVRYTWSDSDERIFFLNKNLQPIETNPNINLFPGLREFLNYCLNHKSEIVSKVNEARIPDLLSIDEPRGPQSFAFGHYIVDILPVLFYLQLFKKSSLASLQPLLIYGISKWHISLHELFGIPMTSVFPLNSQNSSFSIKTSSGREINLYAANIKLISCDIQLLRKCFSNNLKLLDRPNNALTKIDVLFLVRKELGGRPIRWTNQDMFESVLIKNNEVCSTMVDPARIMPSTLAAYTNSTSIVISPPGSSAYIPLHISKPNVFIIMPVSFDCGHKMAWNYTLSMFSHYSNKLIIVSNADSNICPSSAAWDRSFSINQLHLMSLITNILSITKSKGFTLESSINNGNQDELTNNLRYVVRFGSLTASLPPSFKNSITTLLST